jgi:hypothetical protein
LNRRLALALLLPAVLALPACGRRKPDLSSLGAPSARLVGHWADGVGDESFFSSRDGEGIGQFTMIHPDGRTFRHRYQIVRESAREQTTRVRLLFADGDSAEATFAVSADGRTLTETRVITGIETTTSSNRTDDRQAP